MTFRDSGVEFLSFDRQAELCNIGAAGVCIAPNIAMPFDLDIFMLLVDKTLRSC